MQRIKVGEIGVDSGQIMIIDPCYIPNNFQGDGNVYFENENGVYGPIREVTDYTQACIASLNGGFGTFGSWGDAGASISSGYGDGTYPVYVEINNEGRVMKAEIIFDNLEAEEEVCEECGEYIEWCDCCPDCGDSACQCDAMAA